MMRPNSGLVTDEWVRCAHPPAAQRQSFGGRGPERTCR